MWEARQRRSLAGSRGQRFLIVLVPGADASNDRIAKLEGHRRQIETEISELERKRTELLNYRQLLFGYGRVLERVVRQAFKQLGFAVLEPEAFGGDWDVELREPTSSKTAIGEIEGSEGPIDVEKFRQLLNYFQAEVLEGRAHTGILIGNGYRSRELDAPERRNQFTEHALRGAKRFGFCL